MPREHPHRITTRKLLRFTGQQSECAQIHSALERHERAVARLKKAGLKYDPETGTLKPEDQHE